MRTFPFVLALAIAVLSGAGGHVSRALADDDEHDHDRARRALERGEIVPLPRILARVERDQPGQVVEVELEREHGRWIYEIKLVKPGGALVALEYDARDGSPLRREDRGDGAGRR